MVNKSQFDFKIWGYKVFTTTLAVLIAGGIVVWQDNPVWLALLPIAKALENYIKHR